MAHRRYVGILHAQPQQRERVQYSYARRRHRQRASGIKLERNFFNAGFDANWEIDVFGGVRRSVEAADAIIEATEYSRRDILVSLLGDVARNYIDLRGAQRRLAVARANLKTQQDSLDLTRVRFDAGLASDLDVARAEAQLNSTASQVPTLESFLKQAAYSLDLLLGLSPGALMEGA